MKVGLILHVAYRGLGDGDGPILECLGKVVADDYFDAVEVARINDPEVRRAAAGLIRTGHMVSAYGGQGRTLSACPLHQGHSGSGRRIACVPARRRQTPS